MLMTTDGLRTSSLNVDTVNGVVTLHGKVPTDTQREIYAAACRLLASVETEGRGFRLTGVGVAGFESTTDAAVQLDLLTPAAGPARGAALQAVMSAVRERFGHQALFPAAAGPERRPGTTGAISERLPEPTPGPVIGDRRRSPRRP